MNDVKYRFIIILYIYIDRFINRITSYQLIWKGTLRSIRLASLWVCARSLVWYSILTGQEDAAGVSKNHERIHKDPACITSMPSTSQYPTKCLKEMCVFRSAIGFLQHMHSILLQSHQSTKVLTALLDLSQLPPSTNRHWSLHWVIPFVSICHGWGMNLLKQTTIGNHHHRISPLPPPAAAPSASTSCQLIIHQWQTEPVTRWQAKPTGRTKAVGQFWIFTWSLEPVKWMKWNSCAFYELCNTSTLCFSSFIVVWVPTVILHPSISMLWNPNASQWQVRPWKVQKSPVVSLGCHLPAFFLKLSIND